ncbi:MAG TPA: redox-regulated ATPase YchF [Pyrinomonadaceae bacterium]|jgi:GTP-binding protein YchF|nr:redox-regulated ATPase YchF [Pyrinomonadaceae bacterium]
MLRAGFVGLPNVGKTTLFNAVTAQSSALIANYAFSTSKPNVGVVAVPDERLAPLAKLVKTDKIVPASVEFVDIAGLVRGSSQGEGMGNQFLHAIRETDTIVHVVRCFDNETVVHVEDTINPRRDIETIQIELALADLATVERRRERVEKTAKSGDKAAKAEVAVLDKIQPVLEEFKPARSISLSDEENAIARNYFLLTMKPTIYAANVNESTLTVSDDENVKAISEVAASDGSQYVVICAQLEADLVDLSPAERIEYLESLGVKSSGVDQLIKSAYRVLGLMSFLTAGEKEARAWTIPQNSRAQDAAGAIHSDIARGFIRAEIVSYEDLIRVGSYAAARDQGLLRLEGKDYIMQEGDIVNFRFNV